jgi:uncharacterized protein YlxP (DUF503 family)
MFKNFNGAIVKAFRGSRKPFQINDMDSMEAVSSAPPRVTDECVRRTWSCSELPYTSLMIAFLTLELRIEGAHSLKDKRQVTRSLKDRLRGSFNVSVAELEPSPLWNQATIGVVSVSHSRDYLDGLMKNVERAATRIANNAGADVTDSFVEFV